MDFRIRETIRYLGYGKHAVDEQTCRLIAESFEDLELVVRERFIYRIFAIEHCGEYQIRIGTIEMKSKYLIKNMMGCSKAVLFGATLGIEVDRLLQKLAVTDMAKAVIMQACAAARMEELCDRMEAEIKAELPKPEQTMRPRFSPGYGDLSIEYQKEILRVLDASKKIGLTMTRGCMLSPTKSVTAFIGIKDQKDI